MALALSAYPFPYNSSCGHVFISVVKHPGMALLGLAGQPASPILDNPLQNSCLGNPMDTGAWQATVHGVAKEWDMTERLNNNSD